MAKRKQQRPKHIPLRTCVVCRQKTDKRLLTRIVRTSNSEVIIDLSGKRNGRGAYLCDQPACWKRAVEDIGLLNRALKTEISDIARAEIASHAPNSETAE